MAQGRILVVDDDREIVKLICLYLENEGYETLTAYNGRECLERIGAEKVDLLVLDIMMPELDGMEACRRIRETQNIPIIFVSAKGEPMDKIMGLATGADDYLTKPFELEELWVRIQVQLRHRGSMAGEKELIFKDWVIDQDARVLKAGGKAVELTAHELGIVELLMRHPKKVFTKQEIYEAVWQQDAFIEDKTINVHVSNIRAKLRAGGAQDYIQTVWGIGFKMTE